MKKIFMTFWIMLIILTMSGCSHTADDNVQNISEKEVSVNVENTPEPVYAKQIKDGTYEITVDSSSSMFHVVKCELIVEDKNMYAVMTMSGQGYGMVYMGTAEQALEVSETEYIPFVLNENEEKTFTVPVEALDKEINCAAWSIKKEKWYDRTLVFKSEAIPTDALELE